MLRSFKDRIFRFLFFPSVALWLMTIAVFPFNLPIHFSSRPDDVITQAENPIAYWSLKLGLLLITLAFSISAVLRHRALHRANI
ncbi:MAG: hypothetical protein DME32_18270 [Verrucomicrobia bacterium]|nr:MAG: hypothetical protein DME32_18270 [Verrucomicrobiota bacterium]